eukprot:11156337-Lingulodinium_polyedra.AAC.1
MACMKPDHLQPAGPFFDFPLSVYIASRFKIFYVYLQKRLTGPEDEGEAERRAAQVLVDLVAVQPRATRGW